GTSVCLCLQPRAKNSTGHRLKSMLLWELRVRFYFKKLLGVALAVRAYEKDTLVGVDFPQESAFDNVRSEVRSAVQQLDGLRATLQEMLKRRFGRPELIPGAQHLGCLELP